MNGQAVFRLISLALVGLAFVSPSRAEVFTYDVQPDTGGFFPQTRSQIDLTVSGTLFGGVVNITEQFPDSETRYNGTIAANVSANGVGFTGGGESTAQNLRQGFFGLEQNVTPGVGGSGAAAPANYGVMLSAPIGFDIPNFTIPAVPGIPGLENPIDVNLGTLSSIDVNLAVRDLGLSFDSGGQIFWEPGQPGSFDASQVDVSIESGVVDLQLAAVLEQDDLITYGITLVALEALEAALPDIGLTVTGNYIPFINPELTIDIGFGLGIGLGGLPDVPNTATDLGTLTGFDGGPGSNSEMILPVEFAAIPDFDLPDPLEDIITGIVDLEFGFAGTLESTAVIPEASTFILAGLGLMVAYPIVRRRRRS